MSQTERPVLYYFHDPMCSWCWGYRPSWLQLKAVLPAEVSVQNMLGGLAPDTDEPMPAELQLQIQAHWRRIQGELGARFNFDFWSNNQPRRSTYPACRAVLAADLQGQQEAMIEAIQRAYYLHALNPSDNAVLVQFADELGLNETQFYRDIRSQEVQQVLAQQVAFARTVVSGFPSLMLSCDGAQHPIILNYRDYMPALRQIGRLLAYGRHGPAKAD